MSRKGEWIANCTSDRVGRISSASIFMLTVGPPKPNQMQTLEDLEANGVVGLYKVGKKDEDRVVNDQNEYLRESDFAPAPDVLMFFAGAVGSENNN